MRSIFCIGLLPAALAVSASAQVVESGRAFEPSVTPWVGLSSFGDRIRTQNSVSDYRSSPTVGLRAEFPLTRRIGLLGGASVAPFSKQSEENVATRAFFDDVVIYRADAGLGWKFKPAAPVFFYGGGGVFGATKYALRDTEGSPLDPMAAVGLGYDRASSGAWSFRLMYTSYFVFPSAPDPPPDSPSIVPEAKSLAHDWSLQFGGRYTFGRGR
ncbi:MAG: hypothetical protein ABR543_14680 [Gemmatimonadaceae bacterium]